MTARVYTITKIHNYCKIKLDVQSWTILKAAGLTSQATSGCYSLGVK